MSITDTITGHALAAIGREAWGHRSRRSEAPGTGMSKRPPWRSSWSPDWEALHAVQAAAQAAGLTGELLGWARSNVTLREMGEAYVARYAEAYGLGADGIDVPTTGAEAQAVRSWRAVEDRS